MPVGEPERHSRLQIQDSQYLLCASVSGDPPATIGDPPILFLKLPDCIVSGKEYNKEHSRKLCSAAVVPESVRGRGSLGQPF